ncbi:MAG: PDDEXK nuclease domain-containing protein [Proteobacteria bacterium]|nr:PDDEXK nuclease domain-containing protein [Pseudomonadota bacterium]
MEDYTEVLDHIGREIDSARLAVAKTANQVITRAYWEIGRRIVELEQRGKSRTELYGERIIDRLSVDLARRYGRGFSRSNLYNFKAFYLMKNIVQTVSGQSFPLSWSHYIKLLSVKDTSARVFYEESAIRDGWTARQLDRQVGSNFYERAMLAKDRATLMANAKKSLPQEAIVAEAAIKDPVVLEFLGLKDEYSESDLEAALIGDLEAFLLELGTDFAFIGRQRRLLVGTVWYRVDLLFFHRRLRCLVIIDLKIGELTHADVGQMNLYTNYAKKHWTNPDENDPVGLILCAGRNAAVAEYALENLPHIKAAEYIRQLPDKKMLEEKLASSRLLNEALKPSSSSGFEAEGEE